MYSHEHVHRCELTSIKKLCMYFASFQVLSGTCVPKHTGNNQFDVDSLSILGFEHWFEMGCPDASRIQI